MEEKKEGFLNRAYKNVSNKINREIDSIKLNKSIKEEFNKGSITLSLHKNLLLNLNYNKEIKARLDIDKSKITILGKFDIKADDILKDKNGTSYVAKVILIKNDYLLVVDGKEHKIDVTEISYKTL